MANAIDLRISNLRKYYRDVVALNCIDLEVPHGEFISLLGPSGCGKSTMLRLIAGLIEPTTGDIIVRGQSMRGVPAHKRDIGIVFQNYALFPHMTVFDNVSFGLDMRSVEKQESRQRVSRALDLVRLAGFEGRYPYQLSGGQQQRVALARALVIEPKILLLDESLGALDKRLRLEMERELKALQRTLNVTTVFVTHDQEEALTMSDRVAVMNEGRIEQLGPPREIYEHPATKFVLEFIGETNQLKGRSKSECAGFIHVSVAENMEIIVNAISTRELESGDVPQPMDEDEDVLVAVRPENVHLSVEPPELDSLNVFEVRVEDIMYIGNNVLYYLILPNNQVMRAERPNIVGDRIQNDVRLHDSLYAYWSPESTIMFRGESS